MPQVVDVLRLRRNRATKTTGGLGARPIFFVLLAALSLIIMLALLLFASLHAEVTSDLPEVTSIESQFGDVGHEYYAPVRFFDRSGEILLFEAQNPAAQGVRWLYIQDEGLIDLQQQTLLAFLAAVDPDFLTRSMPTTFHVLRDFTARWFPGVSTRTVSPFSRMLVETQLMPLGINTFTEGIHQTRIHLLALELERSYPKSQILEWFVNSADFGRDAYGLDAAALVYLGKHASDLTLGESALLASIVLQPTLNPFNTPEESFERQMRLLERMVELGWITAAEARQAGLEDLRIISEQGTERTPLQDILVRWLQLRLGSQSINRSGLTVFTTIDQELQQQAECTLATQLRRLDGGIGSETVPTFEGETCLAASLLPPLRPRDQGFEHQIETGAFIILDPQTGEILALSGVVDVGLPVGPMLSPLVYLTAFAQGYSPGSMVLDLPIDVDDSFLLEGSHGPIRIRTAIANYYSFATERMLDTVGQDAFMRIARNLGLRLGEGESDQDLKTDSWQASLIDLAAAYGVLAFQGQQVGSGSNGASELEGGFGVQPEILFEVEDSQRQLVYRYEPASSAVVSPQLAYLVNDILRDEPARWPSYGTGNPLEIGRPVSAIAGMSGDGHGAWTIGYTPSRVVGVWIGNLGETPPEGMEATNSAAAVWHAIMQYATRDVPPQNWNIPPGVSSLEVCDPSGLLPTVYCPEVVNEVFLSGTEPTTFDNLYQPFRINEETGKLATLYTPIEQVQERVYLVPPPEALAWAEAIGLDQPPKEYDTLTGEGVSVAGVGIQSPAPFTFVRDQVVIRGQANIADFSYYRLQYGEGLNPTRWVQIGEEITRPMRGGTLARWDTSGLNGLYTLQLIVVDEEGQLATSVVNLTIDNQPPEVEIILPLEGDEIELSSGAGVVLQTSVADAYGIDHVSFFIDGQQISTVNSPPYSARVSGLSTGIHSFYVQVKDLAGNISESLPVQFTVVVPGK